MDGLRPGKRKANNEILAAADISYFIVDAHQLRRSP